MKNESCQLLLLVHVYLSLHLQNEVSAIAIIVFLMKWQVDNHNYGLTFFFMILKAYSFCRQVMWYDEVAKTVFQFYETLPKTGRPNGKTEWTNLAAFLTCKIRSHANPATTHVILVS